MSRRDTTGPIEHHLDSVRVVSDSFDPTADVDPADAGGLADMFDDDLDDDLRADVADLIDADSAGWSRAPRRRAHRSSRAQQAAGERAETEAEAGGFEPGGFERTRHPERLVTAEVLPDHGGTWSTFLDATKGPQPWPGWLIPDRTAVDIDLGILKTGKEADVYLLDRFVPGTERHTTLAVKRYRDTDHSQFTRDAAYLAGRRVRKSRDQRAMDNKTRAGRSMLAGQWAVAEFGYLCQLWELGAPVPYPVQLLGSELMMEFITDSQGRAAPRLAQLRPDPATARALWDQLVEAMLLMAEQGWAHGDLSPFNLLVAEDRLVLIDVPQVIDVVANPDGLDFLLRDARNVCSWFAQHGIDNADPADLGVRLLRAAGMA